MAGKRSYGATVNARVLAVLALCATAIGGFSPRVESQSRPNTDSPGSAATQRRLSFEDLEYQGAFRLPKGATNGETFGFGGMPVAFNPSGQSLLVGSRRGLLADVTIPKAIHSATVTDLPFAEFRQDFVDPTHGRLQEVGREGIGLSGAVVLGDRVYGAVSIYFDANNSQRLSHFSQSLKLGTSDFRGWSSVWEPTKTGFVAGFMALIPTEWQSLLGGTALTGQCCLPIVSRTSWGPAAFAFDLTHIGERTVAAAPLLYYTGDHATLGPWEGSNERYGIATGMGGVAVIGGTRSALFFGRNGMGPACYGTGTAKQALAGSDVGDGSKYCYDPTNDYKATHAYPYRFQIWAYDLNDFAAVKAGKKKPWDVVPYGIWPIEFPIVQKDFSMGGVGYDPQQQLIYVAQMHADQDGDAYRPLIHVFHVR
jgi:hypothetical protein